MKIDQLCRTLAGLTAESNAESPRCFIQFPNLSLYNAFVRQALRHARMAPEPDGLELLSASRMIRCRIPEPRSLLRLRGPFHVEVDHRLQVESKFYLPFAGEPSSTFDPKQKIPWGVTSILAPKLWSKTKGRHIRIGVVDTGVDYQHPNIRASLMKGVNIIHRHLSAADDNGHGTHIAGTIASCGSERGASGFNGVAPKAVLYPVKAFDHEGSAYVSDIIQAIEWCIGNRMDIINMSFGMAEYSPSLLHAVKSAHQRNVIIVASSGNGGKPNAVDYPAKLPYTIAVGALNKRGRIAAFSNRGKEVDVYAPGEAIYSTWPGKRYNELNGTSMAAAHVSGALALLMAGKPRMSKTRIAKALIASAMPLVVKGKARSGAGRLNVLRAWHRLRGQSPVKKPSCRRRAKRVALMRARS